MKKTKAPTPAFCQSGMETRPLTVVSTGESLRTTTPAKTLSLCRLNRRETGSSLGETAPSLLHLMDKSSPSDEEMVPLKRQRVKVDDEAIRGEESTGGALEPACPYCKSV